MPKKSKKNLILIILVILVIAGIVAGIIINRNKKYHIELETITKSDVQFYVVQKDNKFGVIDKNGTIVIEPQYDNIKIPNPTKDIFVCLVDEDNDIWKAVDQNNEQKWTNYNSVDSISLRAITSLVPYEKSVLKYKQGNYYGIMDFEGNIITEPIYEEITTVDYKEGYLKVKKEGQYGVINIKGVQILDEEYDDILFDGYYDEKNKYLDAGFILRIKTDDGYRFGYATTTGKIILNTTYNEVNRITEIDDKMNLYFITSVNGKYGFIKNSKTVLENDYREIRYDKTNNILIAQKDSNFGVFDLTGKNIIPIDYDTILIGGEYINAYKGEDIIIFNKNGQTITTEDSSKEQVSNDYSIVIDKDNNYNIVDRNNRVLLGNSYTYLEYFKDDMFIVTDNTKTGVIRANGQIVVPIEYSTIQKIDGANCLQATVIENNETSIINSAGKIQNSMKMSTLIKEDNYIKILSDSDVKYYTLEGNETTYKNLVPNNNVYAIKQNDKWGFADSQGNIVVNCEYDFVTEQNGNFVGVKKDGKWGILNIDGTVVKEPVYELSFNNVKFLGEYYEISSNVGLPIYSAN